MKNKKVFLCIILTLSLAVFGMQLAGAKELRVGLQSQHKGADVQDQTSNSAAQILYSIYDTLIERDPYSKPLKFKPGLAVSWKMINPTTMELKLRKGVMFHDGSTFDAQDVAYSLGRVFSKKHPGSHPGLYATTGRFFYNFDRVEVVDGFTVRISTKRPDPLMKILLSARNAGIASKEYLEKVGLDGSNIHPIGTGPYKVVSNKPGQQMVLERFGDFWGKKPPLDKITFTKIPEISSRITALVNKEVDFIVSVTPDQEVALRNRKGIRLVGVVWPMFHVYVLNMYHPVTGNKKLRQAMKLAIDREALVKGLWAGKGIVPKAHQFKEYGKPLYMPKLKLIKYDPEKARKLVKESGYDGTPVLLTFLSHYYTYGNLAAQAIAEMWQKVGINVKLQSVEKFKRDLSNIMIRPWSNPMYYPDPMGAYDTHWAKASWTYTRKMFRPEDHPKWFELYEKARFSTDVKERKQAYTDLLIAAEDLAAYILLYQPYESYAMRSDIKWKIPTNLRPYCLTFRAGQIKVGK